MSVDKIRAPLEIALYALTPTFSTKWENQVFTPPAIGTPWQEVRFIFNDPVDTEMTAAYHQERGVMQVVLHYPAGAGTAAAAARAILVRGVFPRGNTFLNGGVTTQIEQTPRIGQGIEDSERSEWVLPVTIRFKADIFL